MSSSKTPEVVVAGHICLDIIPDMNHIDLNEASEFYAPGRLRNTAAAVLSPGGPVSNTGLALVKLGINAALMGKVGQDPFGQLIKLLLKDRWSITKGLAMTEGATTSYTVVICPRGFDRMFLHCPGANDTFSADDVDYDLVAQAKLFHLGYPPLMERMYENNGQQLIEIFRRVKTLGVTTSLDMALPDPGSPSGRVDWKSILEKLIPYVDFFLPSAEETLFMINRPLFDKYRSAGGDMIAMLSGDDLHELSQTLLDMGGKIVSIKAGSRGIYLRTGGAEKINSVGLPKQSDVNKWIDRELWHPAFEIQTPPNATGSGDSAIAGFLAAMLRAHTPEEAIAYANGTGACNVMAPDALSGIKPWDELSTALKNWTPMELKVEGNGWSCTNGVIWTGPSNKQ